MIIRNFAIIAAALACFAFAFAMANGERLGQEPKPVSSLQLLQR
jgi:hypothetical protein